MGIADIKIKLSLLESEDTSTDVYKYLRLVWNSDKSAEVAVLIIDEMVSFMIYLDTCITSEHENEYKVYSAFFHEVIEYGLNNHLQNKIFLWLMIYYLEAVGTYYFIVKTSLCQNGSEEALVMLKYKAELLYPQSVMIKLIPTIQSGNKTWINRLNAEECRKLGTEIDGLNLQDNSLDAELKRLFQVKALKQKLEQLRE